MGEYKWILCPVCNSKTRLRVREDTELKNFPTILSEMQTGNFN